MSKVLTSHIQMINESKLNAIRRVIDELDMPFAQAVQRVSRVTYAGSAREEFIFDKGQPTELLLMTFDLEYPPMEMPVAVIEVPKYLAIKL